MCKQQVRKRFFFRCFYTKMIMLPRQARGKHRKTSKHTTVFPQVLDQALLVPTMALAPLVRRRLEIVQQELQVKPEGMPQRG